MQRLFSAGAQLFQQRRFAEAAVAFRRATVVAPASAPAWCNLAAALVELREPAEALAAAERAIALAPGFAPAHANRGDALRLGKAELGLVRDAYRRAVELQPRSPDLLNKLATTLQAMGELDAADAAYAGALALAPAYRLARLNRGCLLILRGEVAHARELAREALTLPGTVAAEHEAFAAALAIIDRNLALEPLLREAVAARAPQAFVAAAAAAAGGRAEAHDAGLLACVAGCLRRVPADPESHTRTGPDSLNDVLEAHFSAHLGEDAGAVRATAEFLERHAGLVELPSGTDHRLADAWNYLDALRQWRALGAGRCGSAPEAVGWLRYWHAALGRHRPELAPGQLKAFPNSVIMNPDIERTDPARVQGTLEQVHALLAGLPPSPARAALAYYVVADVHPFADGNGRLGRFLMNRELEAAGLGPAVHPKSFKPAFGRALNAIRREQDLRPFVSWLADCDGYTRGMRAAVEREREG